jgi:serine/threonine-protein kinase
VREISRSLKEAHDLGIVHRDLKPSNIMLIQTDQGESVKVLDFGIAKVLEDEEEDVSALTCPDVIMGSPLYMAPEQIQSRGVDARSDIYSLGVMFYQMIAGNPPFRADKAVNTMLMHLSSKVPPIKDRAVGKVQVPPQVEEVVRKCLAKKAKNRFENVGTLQLALAAASVGLPPTGFEDTSMSTLDVQESTLLLTGAHIMWRRLAVTATAIAVLVAILAVGALGALAVMQTYQPTPVAEKPLPPMEDHSVFVPVPPKEPSIIVIPTQITSEPAGAEIWEGTRLHGVTPLALDIVEGKTRQFTLKLAGHIETPLELTGHADQTSHQTTMAKKARIRRPPPIVKDDIKISR